MGREQDGSPVSLPISRCIYGWILRHLRDGENRGYHVCARNGQWQFEQTGCNSCGLWRSFQTFPAVDPTRHSSQTLICSQSHARPIGRLRGCRQCFLGCCFNAATKVARLVPRRKAHSSPQHWVPASWWVLNPDRPQGHRWRSSSSTCPPLRSMSNHLLE